MATTAAAATRTVKFLTKAGTYTSIITSPDGDLVQEYEEANGVVTNIYPDFATTQPSIYFVCTSSRVAEGDYATVNRMAYYFNGIELDFDASTNLCTNSDYAGMFMRIKQDVDNGVPYWGLQILSNLVGVSGKAPCTFKMVGTVAYGTQTDDISSSYTLPIRKASGNSYRVTITSPDNKFFTIDGDGGSCQLMARAYQGATELTSNLTYAWEKMGATDWEPMAATTQTISVSDSDIATNGEYRVTVSLSGNSIGSDTQQVYDVTDEYVIEPGAYPPDETIEEDADGNGEVVYTPKLTRRSSGTEVDAQFYIVRKDSAGVIQDTETEAQTLKTSYTVTRDMCLNVGGDISVTFTAVI